MDLGASSERAVRVHREDLEFGYRLVLDEAREIGGQPMAGRTNRIVGYSIDWRMKSRLAVTAFGNAVTRPVSDRPCSLASRTSSAAARCSADCSACFFFATSFSVAVIRRQPFPPNSRSTRQAGNIVSRTVPRLRLCGDLGVVT